MQIHGDLTKVLSAAVAAAGYVLWGAEIQHSGKRGTLVVFIDGNQGITIDDCEKASRQISAVLEVEQQAMSDYTLEVSSPGLYRPLYTLVQFQRFIGEPVKLRLKEANADNRKNFAGILLGAAEDNILIQVDDDQFNFRLDDIAQAHLNPSL